MERKPENPREQRKPEPQRKEEIRKDDIDRRPNRQLERGDYETGDMHPTTRRPGYETR